jgi:aryl-alcohol dehydrogenase-like predicted oxidoreductase
VVAQARSGRHPDSRRAWHRHGPVQPAGKGFLTGKINEDSKLGSDNFGGKLPRFTPETMKANQGFVDLLASIAKEKSATPAQIALAWLLVQKPWIVPIPGTTNLSRLEENIGAVGIELTEAELRTIDEASSKIKVEGDPIA